MTEMSMAANKKAMIDQRKITLEQLDKCYANGEVQTRFKRYVERGRSREEGPMGDGEALEEALMDVFVGAKNRGYRFYQKYSTEEHVKRFARQARWACLRTFWLLSSLVETTLMSLERTLSEQSWRASPQFRRMRLLFLNTEARLKRSSQLRRARCSASQGDEPEAFEGNLRALNRNLRVRGLSVVL